MLLTVLTAVGKVMGALFRVPLVGILGAEGMGYYQSVFPVYALLLTLVSSGVSTATARLVAGSVDEPALQKSVRRGALFLSGLLGLVASLLIVALSAPISALQGDKALWRGYVAIAPAILPAALVAVMRGAYQGTGDLRAPALSQLVEQGAKLLLGLGIAVLLSDRGWMAASIGALVGVALSELVALLYLAVPRKQGIAEEVKPLPIDAGAFSYGFFRVIRTAIPLVLVGLVHPLSHFFDSLTVVNVLSPLIGQAPASAQYGLYSGAVCSLISLPTVLTVALAVGAIPSLSGESAGRCGDKLAFSLKLSACVGVVFSVLYLAVPEAIVGLLYPSLSAESAGKVVGLLSLSVPALLAGSVNQIYSAFLQGVGMGQRAIKNSFIGLAVKVVLGVILLRVMGIGGIALATGAGQVLGCLLNVVCWQKYFKSGKILKNVSLIGVLGAIMFVSGRALAHFVGEWVLPCMAILCVVFVLSVLKTGVFSREEIQKMPFSTVLVALSGKKELKSDNDRGLR